MIVMSSSAITAEQLSYRYGQLLAVDQISFEVSEGEILGFLGPNGAGESTTVKIEIPQWSARIFPTYYVVQPVIEIAQHGAGLSDIAWQLGILLLLIVGMGIALILLTRYSPRPRTV